MQYAVVILDGASGEAVEEFGGQTSLEASETPYLDALARGGLVGLAQNVPQGMVSGSDVACLSIMGYDPELFSIGRGAIEAAALGIELVPGQVALRMNLCTVEAGIMRSYSAGNISDCDGKALANELKARLDDETFTLYPGISFRQVLLVSGLPEVSRLEYGLPHDFAGLDVSDRFLPKALGEQAPEQQAAQRLAEYLFAANEILVKSPTNKRRVAEGKLPANCTWLLWPGKKPETLLPFEELYGKRAAVNSAVDLLVGLAKLANMGIYRFEGVTDGPTNDFSAQGLGALQMLEDGNDLVFIHVEAPDAAGHDGDFAEKKRAIEQSDRFILGPLLEYAKTHPLRIAVLPDHPTPIATRRHANEPVPFVVAGPGIAHNGVSRMTELSAASTGLFLEHGHRLIADLLL